jgi:F0F1-type ATP synthase membrane subunit b/b'
VELLSLLEELESLIVQSRRLPVGGNLVIDRKQLLDVVDRLRLALPEDLAAARRIIETRDAIEREAHERAREIIDEAENQRARLIDEDSITEDAERRAAEIVAEAQQQARQIIDAADATAAAHLSEAAEAAREQLNDADQYALEVLERLDQQLGSFLDSIQQGIAGLQERRD